jgi:predicted DNA-binding transcriptional regulator AlpA
MTPRVIAYHLRIDLQENEMAEPKKSDQPQKFLDYVGLRALGIKFSKVHLYRMAKEGRFPKPVKLFGSTNAYVEAEVLEWMDKRIAASREVTSPAVKSPGRPRRADSPQPRKRASA